MLGLNLSKKPAGEKIRWAFRLYDISQDGLIQRAEIKQVRQVISLELLGKLFVPQVLIRRKYCLFV